MIDPNSILNYLLETEEDDDFSSKDVTDIGSEEVFAGPTTVQRHGRWKVVDMINYTFLISYLTPVAYHDKRTGAYYRTKKQWSPTTSDHIRQWQQQIAKSPEWKDNPANRVFDPPTEWNPEGRWWTPYPGFESKRQDEISGLFRKLMTTMDIPVEHKKRMYHVDPNMRQGSTGQIAARRYMSAHNKHKDSGEQGLPRKDWRGMTEPELEKFFSDFNPDSPEFWDWQQGERRSQEPHEPDE